MFRPASELDLPTSPRQGEGEGTWTGELAYVMTEPLRPPPQASCEGVVKGMKEGGIATLHTSVPRYLKGDLTIEENQETSRCFPKGLSPNGRLPHPPSLSYAAGPLGAAAAGLPHLVSGRPCGDAGGDPDPRRGTGGPQHTLSDVTYLPPGSFDRPPPRGRTGGSPTPRGPGPLPGRDVAGGGPCGRPLLLPAPHRPPAHRRRYGPGPRAPGTCVRCATVTLHHRRGDTRGPGRGPGYHVLRPTHRFRFPQLV